ncbi:MAG TPA: lipase family protein [Candidatus Corynebacterium avicola]|uniref:Lipase family protein n=1 Tax=Candidatus Corynebacterium avicola TaxID=2838527 RepID=A0A9D1UL27_9CORY|nr:lipase family protein [Candidatus Corynebacterium avicola]
MTFPHRISASGLSVLASISLIAGATAATAAAGIVTSPDGPGTISASSATAPGVPPSLAEADPTIADPASDPFYTPPTSIPSTPGSLIRDQFAPHLLAGFDREDAPARADKILYTSTAQDGSPIATSGFVMEPARPWSGEGPTPTIVFGPGTRGAGDDCAPSRSGHLLFSADNASDNVNLNYEYPFYAMASAAGYRVVVTDYIGLGTPGQHTYVNHTEEGHAVLDAARAGLAFADAPADSPVAFFGYSQGGGAVAGAAELASSYAPELNLKGVFAGAPPANLEDVTDTVDGSMGGNVLGFALNGALARNPELTPLADKYFNDEGKAFLYETAAECTFTMDDDAPDLSDFDVTDPVGSFMFDSRRLTADGRSFGEIIQDDDDLRRILLGPDYRLGDRPVDVPMFILGAVNDDTIPYGQTKQLAEDYCASGTTVKFLTDDTPAVLTGTGLGHAVPQINHATEVFDWIGDRFNGVDAASTCGN